MPTLKSLSARWCTIVEELRDIGPMRSGSICLQKVKYEAKDGTLKKHGPYPILTFKEAGKTKTLRLDSEEDINACKKQIENFRRFKEKTGQLSEIGKQMADMERAETKKGKKNSPT